MPEAPAGWAPIQLAPVLPPAGGEAPAAAHGIIELDEPRAAREMAGRERLTPSAGHSPLHDLPQASAPRNRVASFGLI